MFGPNTHLNFSEVVNFSHRDTKFSSILSDLESIFVKKFKLDDFDILFLNGGGTLGVESVIWSSKFEVNVTGPTGTFFSRWKSLSDLHNAGKDTTRKNNLYCQLETSSGALSKLSGGFVDSISSFPYFDLPECDAFITCSNKQLGSIPGLVIIGVKKNSWDLFRDSSTFSYLNLARYYEYSKINQTPSTPTYPIMMNLLNLLEEFDLQNFKDTINLNCEILQQVFNFENSPVLHIQKEKLSKEFATKWNLYGLNTNSKEYSIFTYSCKTSDYESFINEIKNEIIL